MGEFERDAKRTFRQVADGSRSGINWFYGILAGAGVLMGLGALARKVAHMPARDWERVGAFALVVFIVVGIIVWASRVQRREAARQRAERDRQIRPY